MYRPEWRQAMSSKWKQSHGVALAMMQMETAVMATHGSGLNSSVTKPVKTVSSFACGHSVITKQVSTVHLVATRRKALELMPLVFKLLSVTASVTQWTSLELFGLYVIISYLLLVYKCMYTLGLFSALHKSHWWRRRQQRRWLSR